MPFHTPSVRICIRNLWLIRLLQNQKWKSDMSKGKRDTQSIELCVEVLCVLKKDEGLFLARVPIPEFL